MDSDNEWSDWFSYLGEVSFQDIEKVWLSDTVSCVGELINELDPKRYRIKLDGVRVIEYEEKARYGFIHKGKVNATIFKYVIGHDPHNKIIICKEGKE